MKYLRFFFVPVLVIVFSVSALSTNMPKSKNTVSDASVTNLLIGIESENFGLKTSSAFMLGELRSSRAVIPLMKLLHSSGKEEARIIAAISLYKIQSATGLFAIKQAARFDHSERVRRICQNIYFHSLGLDPISVKTDFVSKW